MKMLREKGAPETAFYQKAVSEARPFQKFLKTKLSEQCPFLVTTTLQGAGNSTLPCNIRLPNHLLQLIYYTLVVPGFIVLNLIPFKEDT